MKKSVHSILGAAALALLALLTACGSSPSASVTSTSQSSCPNGGTVRFGVEPFDDARARITGLLIDKTRPFRLSLADRACLALGRELGLSVVTADRSWRQVKIGVEVVLIR